MFKARLEFCDLFRNQSVTPLEVKSPIHRSNLSMLALKNSSHMRIINSDFDAIAVV